MQDSHVTNQINMICQDGYNCEVRLYSIYVLSKVLPHNLETNLSRSSKNDQEGS